LTLSGLWLVDHASTDIPTLGAIPVADLQANVLADAWQAWNLDGDVVQPQGAKALPALISVGGWLAGVPGVLAANVVVGGVGVLAVFSIARRFLSPMAALAPAATLALSVAHLGLSRSAYSEPLTLLLLMAAVHWAWRGLEHGRTGALVAAGIASGATALVRIDGGAYALGVLIGVAIAAAFAGPKARTGFIAFTVAQGAMVGAGYLSLARWSAAYLERLGDEARLLGAVYAVFAALLIIWAATWS
ncbi:glycosyltransferase family 39 protein, partial [Demequina sp. TTPB684]